MLLFNSLKAQDLTSSKISINVRNTTLKVLLTDIEAKSGFNFSYTSNTGNLPVEIFIVRNKNLYETLVQLSQYLHIGFQQEDWIIAIINSSEISLNKFSKNISANSGIVEGIIYNSLTKQPLQGASIFTNNKTYITNNDGFFRIILQPGYYNLNIRYVGNADTIISKVLIKKNEITKVNAYLQSTVYALEEIKVEARRHTNTERSLLYDRRNATTFTDGISSEGMDAYSSITVAQAVGKIPGITVRDDKYVTIDGLSDRNIVATLNGARLSSSNTDHNSTPFDIIPTGFLDGIRVDKTVIPEKPSDGVAGIVDLKTKSIPDSLLVKFSAEFGINNNIGIGGQFYSFKGGSPGLFGQNIKNQDLSNGFLALQNQFSGTYSFVQNVSDFISGSRQNQQNYLEAQRISNIMKSFDPTFTGTATVAPINKTINISIGNNYKVFDRKLGLNISGVYYQNVNEYTGVNNIMKLTDETSTPNNIRLINQIPLTEVSGKNAIIYGLFGTLTYSLNTSNDVSLTILSNSSAEVETTALSGSGSSPYATGNVGSSSFIGKSNYQYYLHSTKRDFNTLQLRGGHRFGFFKNSPIFTWSFSKSKSTQDEPDFRQVSLVVDSTKPDPNYLVNYFYNINSGRFYRYLSENNTNVLLDLSIPIFNKKTSVFFKTGINYLYRDRQFSEIFLSLPDASQLHSSDVKGDLNKLLAADRVGIDQNAFNNAVDGSPIPVGNIYDLSGIERYNGFSESRAFYGQIDIKLLSKTRLTGGVRFENTKIHALLDSSFSNLGSITKTHYDSLFNINYNVNYKPFWSFSAIQDLNKNMVLRISYSQTFSRPEIRELLGVTQSITSNNSTQSTLVLLSGLKLYDPIEQQSTIGNSNLKNSYTQSYNLRWDWFPKQNEIYSFSLFYKSVINTLEKTFNSLNYIQFQNNTNTGLVLGLELEARQSLYEIAPIFKNIFISTNLMFAYSKISYSYDELQAIWHFNPYTSKFHPLFEQPPYSINIQSTYKSIKNGTLINVSFNITGERLIQINDNGTPGIFERPSPNLDLNLSKRILKKIYLAGVCKNLLNSYYSSVYTNSGNDGKFGTSNLIYYRQHYQLGRYYTLGFNYQLK